MTWTPERHAEVKARCEAATDGPWKLVMDYEQLGEGPFAESYSFISSIDALPIDPTDWDDVDFVFISYARTDLPDALAEIERLQERVARLEDDLAAADSVLNDWPDERGMEEALYRQWEAGG